MTRLVVLTTDTRHHRHFVNSLPVHKAFVEQAKPLPSWAHHPYEDEREEYERRWWPESDEWKAPIERVENVNDAVDRIRAAEPEVIVTFGTRKLTPEVIAVCPLAFNLHGGDPQYYRGLDSHLWAIYHKDYKKLTTTLHRLTPELDDGPIVAMWPLKFAKRSTIVELRAINTAACIGLTETLVYQIPFRRQWRLKRQLWKGRYYSHMPGVLKDICAERFARYTASL